MLKFISYTQSALTPPSRSPFESFNLLRTRASANSGDHSELQVVAIGNQLVTRRLRIGNQLLASYH